MSRAKGYVYISRNRVERPVFRSKPSNESSASPSPSQENGSGSSLTLAQSTPPPPPLNNNNNAGARSPPRLPSPDNSRAFHSSADAYSYGRLPLQPPWARPEDMPQQPQPRRATSPPEPAKDQNGEHRTARRQPSRERNLPNEAENTKPLPPEPPKKRNTLKKAGRFLSTRKKEETLE